MKHIFIWLGYKTLFQILLKVIHIKRMSEPCELVERKTLIFSSIFHTLVSICSKGDVKELKKRLSIVIFKFRPKCWGVLYKYSFSKKLLFSIFILNFHPAGLMFFVKCLYRYNGEVFSKVSHSETQECHKS